MHKTTVIFLKVFVPVLGAILAWLGWQTLSLNWMGYFLLFFGSVYFFGILIYVSIGKISSRESISAENLIDEEKRDLSFWLILPGMIVPFFLSPIEFLYFQQILPRNKFMQLAGIIMVFFFVVLFTWTRIVNRKNYSGHLQVTKDQQLIQSGPYKYIRHPAYASYIILTLGVSVAYSSAIGLGAVIIFLIPSIIYRIKIEEDLLIQRFGRQYLDYSRRSARLIPGIW